jgi:hypothetical protein
MLLPTMHRAIHAADGVRVELKAIDLVGEHQLYTMMAHHMTSNGDSAGCYEGSVWHESLANVWLCVT